MLSGVKGMITGMEGSREHHRTLQLQYKLSTRGWCLWAEQGGHYTHPAPISTEPRWVGAYRRVFKSQDDSLILVRLWDLNSSPTGREGMEHYNAFPEAGIHFWRLEASHHWTEFKLGED